MQSSMQKYKKRLLVLSVMLAVVLMITGVSYAVFTSYSSQTDANTLAASCMDLEFNGQNEINLLNTYPISEGEALEQTPYTFTIKNKCDNYIEYYIIASVISTTNKIDSKYVKVSLLGDNDLNGTVINTLESISTPQSLSKYNITENYILKRGDGISKDESRTFNFRMWLDSSNKDIWTREDIEGKNYQVKISVVGTVKTRPKDDLFVATTINGEASSTFPTSKAYSASVSCTQDDKTVDIGAEMKWTGSKWALSVSNLTSGNTKCTVAFDPPTLTDAILMDNEVKTPLTTPGKETGAYTLDDLTQTSTINISSTYQNYYITYGTGWTASGSNFNLTGSTVTSGTYSSSYSSLVGKFLPRNANYFRFSDFASSSASTKKTTTGLNSLYYIVSATSSGLTYKVISSNKNTTEALLASTTDDYGTSYYFRGVVKNNYVEFANKCWRIVRIIGDGSVKLTLHNDNLNNSSNPCSSSNNNTSAAFAHFSGSNYKSAFNTSQNDNTYIGFMYGTSGASSYADAHANKNKSTILANLETWYKNNLASYENKLADTIWCNDKSTSSGLGYGNNDTDYNAANRVTVTMSPTLVCPNDNNGDKLSKFTVNDTTHGNGNLTYKIGLLTSDEVLFAGHGFQIRNETNYLYENSSAVWWWTMSPGNYSSNDVGFLFNHYVGDDGVSGNYVINEQGLRPTIALTSTTRISKGTGTSENPYVIK